MNLAALIDRLPIRLVAGDAAVDITAIMDDSRQAAPGCLFVARVGTVHDGQRFIAEAVAAGAVAVLSGNDVKLPRGTASLTCDDVPLAAALLAERFYRNPGRDLDLVGVTGTNGKTTTTYLIHHVLRHARPSQPCGLIGTVQIDDGTSSVAASLTTPPALRISALLRTMVDNGCATCLMEVSSHALQQQRVAGLAFDTAVFTNISGDHLDYHSTMDAYLAAKARLFALLRPNGSAVVNIDDPTAETIITACADGVNVLTCSTDRPDATCRAEIHQHTVSHIDVTMYGPWGSFDVRLPLCGRHNVMNALQAAAVAHVHGVEIDQLRSALASCTAPPGRLEPVTSADDPFAVYVDYAHTDDALANVLLALRPLVRPGGLLRVVFGCGGDRDRTKRPRMASVAARLADEMIITSDNPRSEDPAAIVQEIHRGVPADRIGTATCIVDRAEAIQTAIERARERDVVLIAGKGHETYQILGSRTIDFDDRAVAAEALAALRLPR